MAVRETLELDISQALNQLNDLERQLDGLFSPLNRADDNFADLTREVDRTGGEFTELKRRAKDADDAILRVGTGGVSAFTNLRGSLIGVASALAAFQGIQVLGRGISTAIEGASQLEEATNKARVVFGQFATNIETFSKTAPQALGLANREAIAFAATFGNLFVALGLSQEAAAQLSPEIVQLGADLASFNDLDVADTLEKLRSGLVGEAEPLRTLGVNINETLVAAKALELGLVGVNGEISEAAKVQARYALILEQTTTAQGDFARTADGIANTQRSLNGEFKNFSDAVGQALIPAFATLLDQAPQILEALDGMLPTITAIGTTVASTDFTGFVSGLLDIARAAVNIPGVLAGFGEDFFTVGQGNQALILSQRTQSLVEELRKGVDPAKALANELAEAARTDLSPEQLEGVAAALAQIAGLPENRLSDLVLTITDLGPGAGLSAEKIKILVGEINKLRTLKPFENPFVDFVQTDVENAISTQADALEFLGIAADTAGVSISDLVSNQAQLTPELAEAAAVLDDSTLAYLRQVDAIDELQAQVGILPGALSAAQEALRDEEGQIVTDFQTFIADLVGTLEDQEQFELDLATLRVRGQDALAAVFEDAGIESREALAGAVSDPAGADLANAELLGQARSAGEEIIEELKASISGLPVTQALIDNLIAAAAAADTPEVRAALLQLAEQLQLEIPVTFSRLPDFPTGAAIQATQTQAAAGVTNIIFNDTPQPTTATVRIQQSLQKIRQ